MASRFRSFFETSASQRADCPSLANRGNGTDDAAPELVPPRNPPPGQATGGTASSTSPRGGSDDEGEEEGSAMSDGAEEEDPPAVDADASSPSGDEGDPPGERGESSGSARDALARPGDVVLADGAADDGSVAAGGPPPAAAEPEQGRGGEDPPVGEESARGPTAGRSRAQAATARGGLASAGRDADASTAPPANGGIPQQGADGEEADGNEREGSALQRVPRPIPELSEEQLRAQDPHLQPFTDADRKLHSVYGDTIHQNDGSHLWGGIDGGQAEDRKMQRLWKRVVAVRHALWRVPDSAEGKRFLRLQTELFQGCREGKWNSERVAIFAACILHKIRGRPFSFAQTKRVMAQRMDAWEAGRLATLVKSIESHAPGGSSWMPRRGGPDTTDEDLLDSKARRFDALVRGGKMRSAVRMLTERDGGNLYGPDDLDTKTGRPVWDVLQDKHPEGVVPAAEDFDAYAEEPDALEVNCWEEDVATIASRLNGAAGPCGVDSQTLESWLLRYGAHSTRLRMEMAEWVVMLSNEAPPYAMYRAMNAGKMFAADKEPGVRPLAAAECWMRLWAKCALYGECKVLAREACGNVQLCAGLEAGIEGNLHAVREVWPESAGWQYDKGTQDDPVTATFRELCTDAGVLPAGTVVNGPAEEAHFARPDPGVSERTEHSRYEPGVGFGGMLADADNGFNRLNRYLMLWTAFHRWRKGSRFAFNRYRHYNIVVMVDEPGRPALILLSKEGVAQGCCFGMYLYGIGLMPLCERVRARVRRTLQAWYADDMCGAATARQNAAMMQALEDLGPKYGYFANSGKSWYVCKGEDEAVARQAFAEVGLTIQFSRGHRYLGGWIGAADSKEEWVKSQVEIWARAVRRLAWVAGNYPQSAYAGFCFSLQMEWQYLSRVTEGTAHLFEPLERSIRQEFLPALLDVPPEHIGGEFRETLAMSVRNGGIGVRNPIATADAAFETSRSASEFLVDTLLERKLFHPDDHGKCVREVAEGCRKARDGAEKGFSVSIQRRKLKFARRLDRAGKAGTWLTCHPHMLNGNTLSSQEFRDNLRLRYNLLPLDMPQSCDGCGARLTVDHALKCKTGGLVHIRHEDGAVEFRELLRLAWSPSHVEREPSISNGADRRERTIAADEQTAEARPDPQQRRARAQRPAPPQQQQQQPTVPPAAPLPTRQQRAQQRQRQQQRQQQQQRPPPQAEPGPVEQQPPSVVEADGRRGDAACHGFWQRGRDTVFDIRITDTDAPSHRGKSWEKVLEEQEKEKKRKYLGTCRELRKDFTPLVYSVDGVPGREARAAERRLAAKLAEKWERPYSQMVHYVRCRMSIAVVRSNSLLLRGSRDRKEPRPFVNCGAAVRAVRFGGGP